MSGKQDSKTNNSPESTRGLPAFDPNPSARFACDLLREVNIPFALIGRVAMWTMLPADEHQFTKDVDFAVPRSAASIIASALARRKIAPRPLSIGGLAVRTDDLRVDFIDQRDGGFERARDIVARHGGPVGVNLFDTLAREAGHPDAHPVYRNGGSD